MRLASESTSELVFQARRPAGGGIGVGALFLVSSVLPHLAPEMTTLHWLTGAGLTLIGVVLIALNWPHATRIRIALQDRIIHGPGHAVAFADVLELELAGMTEQPDETPSPQYQVKLRARAGRELVLISGKVQGRHSVPDLLPHCGPPGGLYSVLDYIRQHFGLDGSPVLLIPVDMPMLTTATLEQLLDSSKNATCCHFEGEVFPCVVKATPDLYMHLRDLFTEGTELGGRRSMKGLFSYLGAKVIQPERSATDEFRTVNTPQEWQALLDAR